MSDNTKIEWTDSTWTPIRARVRTDAAEIARAKGYTSLVQIAAKQAGHVGAQCERCSEGCDNCYSETFQSRCLPHNGTGLPFDRRSRDLVEYFLDEEVLRQPLKWRKPRKVFVCSQTDLFGEWVPDEWINRIFAVMAMCPRITFQVLTKRADRMEGYLKNQKWKSLERPNVHLGVSVENQEQADKRIPHLLRTPATVRFLSLEPLLSEVDLYRGGFTFLNAVTSPTGIKHPGVHWVIAGSESGPGARPAKEEWFRSIKNQCVAADVPFFLKQYADSRGRKIGTPELDGRKWEEFPRSHGHLCD